MITSLEYRSLVDLKRCPTGRFYFRGGLQARALNRTPQVSLPNLHIGSQPQPDQLTSPMRLVHLAEARDEGEVPIAPDLQQRANVVQGALHVVTDAADGARRCEGDGKDGLKPGDGVVALLASHLKEVEGRLG
jgi:hypothetical protein